MSETKKTQILLFALIVAIIPYCYLCFFANPSADDFVLAAQFQENHFLNLIYEQYFIRNGRYISSPLSFLNPIGFNSFLGYKFFPLLLILLVFLSSLSVFQQLFHSRKFQYKMTGSLLFVLLFFHNMPIISEGIYWFTGSVIYVLGLVSCLLYISILIKVLSGKKNGYSHVVLTVFLFLSCGFNEVLTLVIVFLLGVLTFVFHQKKLVQKKIILIQFLFAIAFAAILILAPGNSVRGSAYNESKQLIYSLTYSIIQVFRFQILWIFSIPLIVCSLLYVNVNKELSKSQILFSNSFYLSRLSSTFLLFSIIFICVFPAYWATGILGQHRTLNIAYLFFLLAWFVNLTVWLNHYKVKSIINFKIMLYLFSALIIGIIFTGNGYNTLNDIFAGTAASFNKQHEYRFEELYKAQGLKTNQVSLPQILAKPKCLFTYDIEEEPKDWKNKAYNMYFRLDSVDIFLIK
ncbi:MAG: DUF6056 family protein [Vicingaceae bacterium]|nr:DUF6056 family protein [Vicingaceae bacterium]